MAESTINVVLQEIPTSGANKPNTADTTYSDISKDLISGLKTLNDNIVLTNQLSSARDAKSSKADEEKIKGQDDRNAKKIGDAIAVALGYKIGGAASSSVYSSLSTSFLGGQGVKSFTDSLQKFSDAIVDSAAAIAYSVGGPVASAVTFGAGGLISGAVNAITGNILQQGQAQYYLGNNSAYENVGAGIQSRNSNPIKPMESYNIISGFGAYSQQQLGNQGVNAIYQSAYSNNSGDQLQAFAALIAQLSNSMNTNVEHTVGAVNNLASNYGLQGNSLLEALATTTTLIQLGGVDPERAGRIAAASKYYGATFQKEAVNYETSPFTKKLQAEMIGRAFGVDVQGYFDGTNPEEIKKVNAAFSQNQKALADYARTGNLNGLNLTGIALEKTGMFTGNERVSGQMPSGNAMSNISSQGGVPSLSPVDEAFFSPLADYAKIFHNLHGGNEPNVSQASRPETQNQNKHMQSQVNQSTETNSILMTIQKNTAEMARSLNRNMKSLTQALGN